MKNIRSIIGIRCIVIAVERSRSASVRFGVWLIPPSLCLRRAWWVSARAQKVHMMNTKCQIKPMFRFFLSHLVLYHRLVSPRCIWSRIPLGRKKKAPALTSRKGDVPLKKQIQFPLSKISMRNMSPFVILGHVLRRHWSTFYMLVTHVGHGVEAACWVPLLVIMRCCVSKTNGWFAHHSHLHPADRGEDDSVLAALL